MSIFKRNDKEKKSMLSAIGDYIERGRSRRYKTIKASMEAQEIYIGRGKHLGSTRYYMNFIGKRKRYEFRHKLGRKYNG